MFVDGGDQEVLEKRKVRIFYILPQSKTLFSESRCSELVWWVFTTLKIEYSETKCSLDLPPPFLYFRIERIKV